VESFRKLASKDRFSRLKDFAMKIHSVFESTYVCKSTYIFYEQVKSKSRNRMPDETLDDSFRLAPQTLVLKKER